MSSLPQIAHSPWSCTGCEQGRCTYTKARLPLSSSALSATVSTIHKRRHNADSPGISPLKSIPHFGNEPHYLSLNTTLPAAHHIALFRIAMRFLTSCYPLEIPSVVV